MATDLKGDFLLRKQAQAAEHKHQPCPFCGSTDLEYKISASAGFIVCHNCDTTGPAHLDDCDEFGAWQLWDNRPTKGEP